MAAIALDPRGTCRSLSPLPTQRAIPLREIQIAWPQPDDLGSAAAGGIERLEQRTIAAAEPRRRARGMEQSQGGGRAQHRRQTIPDHRGDQ